MKLAGLLLVIAGAVSIIYGCTSFLGNVVHMGMGGSRDDGTLLAIVAGVIMVVGGLVLLVLA